MGRLAVTAAVLLPLAACGKKGPPLAPLRHAPAQVTDVAGRRAGSEMRIRFTLPTQNVSGGERIDLEQIDIYAITVGPGGIVPPAKEFLTRKYLVKTLPVRPPPLEDEEAVEPPPAATAAVKDPRPLPGEVVTFVENLTEAQLTPVPTKPGPAPKGAPAAVPAVIDPAVPTRYYIVRGRSHSGEPGGSVRLAVPLVEAPPPPAALKATWTEKVLTLEWTAPPAAFDPVTLAASEQAWAAVNAPPAMPVAPPARAKPAAVESPAPVFDPMTVAPLTRLPGVLLPAIVLPVAPRFNVYAVKEGLVEDTPLNKAPVTAPSFAAGDPEWNVERCFVVRTVRTYGAVSIESEPEGPKCFTPVDTFAPAAPTGLRAVAVAGAITLIWDVNSEPDLAGYVVLRGEAPGETLQALTPAPIRETNFRDTTVKSGVQYVYAIVAVDKAATPNMSAQSTRQQELAR